ncbi:MAG: putative ABC exporter domain-containing protein [Bacillota bacterium]
MKTLLFKDLKQIRNYFLEFKQKPKKILPVLFYIIWIGSLFISNNQTYEISYFKKFSIIILSILFIFSILNIYLERKSYFCMADINLAFTAPIEPKKILIYSIIKNSWKQLMMAIFMFVFLLPQILNTIKNPFQLIFGILGYGLFILILEPISFIITNLSKKYNTKKIIFIPILFFVFSISIPIIIEKNLFLGLEANYINFIPFIGWSRGIFLGMFNLNNLTFLFLALQIASIILINLYIIKTSQKSFIENVLTSTENKDKFKQNAKKGKQSFEIDLNINKDKKLKFKKDFFSGQVYHWKNIITQTRKDIHHLVTIKSLFFLIVSIISVFYFHLQKPEHLLTTQTTFVVLGILYVYLIFSIKSGSLDDLEYPIFYLIPDKAINKIISLKKITIQQMFINSIFYIIPPIIIDLKNLNVYILLGLMVNFIYMTITFSNFLIRSFIRNEADFTLMLPLIKIFQLFIITLPSILGTITSFYFSNFLDVNLKILIFSFTSIFNLLFISLILLLSGKIIKNIEI